MRKTLFLIGFILLTLLLAAPAAAQEGPPPPPPGTGGPPGPGPMMGPPPEVALQQALSLTDAQVQGLKALQETARQTAQTVMPELMDAEKALDTAMKSSSPDATQLGQLQLTVKGYRDQIRQADEAVASGFKDLLNADQKAKLNQYLAMKDSLPVLMALQRLHF